MLSTIRICVGTYTGMFVSSYMMFHVSLKGKDILLSQNCILQSELYFHNYGEIIPESVKMGLGLNYYFVIIK